MKFVVAEDNLNNEDLHLLVISSCCDLGPGPCCLS